MADDIRLEMSMEVAKALVNLERMIVKEHQLDQAVAGVSRTSRQAEREWMQAAGQRLRTMGALRTHVEQLGRAEAEQARQYQQALNRGVNFQQKLTAGIAASATEMRGLGRAADTVDEPIGRAGSSVQRLNSNLLTVLGTMGAVTVAASMMRDTIASAEAESGRAADEQRRLYDSERAFAEVAQGGTAAAKAADIAGLRAKSDMLSQTYGLDRLEARELMFEARSLGYEGEVERIAGARQVVGDTGQIAKLVRAGKTAFASEDLTATQLVNMAMEASRSSPLKVSEVASGIMEAGAFSQQIGSSSTEMMGVLSELSRLFPEPGIASQRLMFLAGELAAEPELRGMGIRGGVDKILAMSEEDRKALISNRKEFQQTLGFLARPDVRGRIDRDIAAIDAARLAGNGLSSELATSIEATKLDPALTAVRQAKAAEAKLAAGLQQEGISKLRRQQSVDEVFAEDAELGGSRFKRNFLKALLSGGAYIGDPEKEGESVRNLARALDMPLRRKDLLPGGGAGGGSGGDPQMDEQTSVLKEIRDRLPPAGGRTTTLPLMRAEAMQGAQ